MHLFRGNVVKDDPKEVAAGKVEEMEETGAKYKMEVVNELKNNLSTILDCCQSLF